MKEFVVISGKGGTGKTSIVAAFAALAEKAVLAGQFGNRIIRLAGAFQQQPAIIVHFYQQID